jgi:hypothetical protein
MGIDPNLCPRLIVLLAGALALSSCSLCITTQCRGRPFLPQQTVQIPADPQYPVPISGLDSGPLRGMRYGRSAIPATGQEGGTA